MSVVILSGSTGAGHRMAADAVGAALKASNAKVHHLDAYVFLTPLARWTYTHAHQYLLEFAPRIYGPLYEWGNRSRLLSSLHRATAVRARERLASALVDLHPELVVTTHSVACALAAPLKLRQNFRLAVLTTDYYAHPYQVHDHVDRYCVSHHWAAHDLLRAGVPEERILKTGIPLRPAFLKAPSREEARSLLGLPTDGSMILVTRGGGAAGRETIMLLHALLRDRALADATVIAILGSRDRSYRMAQRALAPSPRLIVRRFVDNMETYLAAADVIIGKAGGLSSTEVFAVGRPLIVYAPNAGIETPNVRRFVAAGAALDAQRSPKRAVSFARDLLNTPAQRAELVAAGRTLVTPGSWQAVGSALLPFATPSS